MFRPRGPGRTVVFIQKARWSSEHHGQTLHLKWTDGEGFELEAERDLLAAVKELFADGDWRTIDEIRKDVGAGTAAVVQIVQKEHADQFAMRTGEDARALVRRDQRTALPDRRMNSTSPQWSSVENHFPGVLTGQLHYSTPPKVVEYLEWTTPHRRELHSDPSGVADFS